MENYSHDERFEAYKTVVRLDVISVTVIERAVGAFTPTTTFDVTFRDRA